MKPPAYLRSLLPAITFSLCLTAGLWAAGAFKGYIFKICIQETFTIAEAEEFLGKEVVVTHPHLAGTRGKAVSVSRGDDGMVYVQVYFQRFGRMADQTIGFPKGEFKNQSIIVLE